MPLTLTYPEGGMLVTGGTGNVGAGIVRRLAAAGVPLVFTYRDAAARAEALAADCVAEGGRVWAQPMDMADGGSIRAALDRVIDECGTIHGVACGAGVPMRFDRLMDFAVADVERFVNADALGYFRIFHAAVPLLRARGGGTLTTCSTIATKRVIDYDGLSPLSKGSVDALVRQVAGEEAGNGIRCNAVAIGWIEARSWDEVRAQTPRALPQEPADEAAFLTALMHQLMASVRMRRPGRPDEAGNLFAFLASNEASFLTGQSFALDGGALL